jgi:hypothetical protein
LQWAHISRHERIEHLFHICEHILGTLDCCRFADLIHKLDCILELSIRGIDCCNFELLGKGWWVMGTLSLADFVEMTDTDLFLEMEIVGMGNSGK